MRRRAGLLAAAIWVASLGGAPSRAQADLASDVDPFIGTLGSGFVFPGPAAPYGMVQLSPDTEGYFAYTGYMWSDQFIRGFSHVHIESMGVPEGGNLPFMPTTGPVVTTDVKRYQSKFDHANEQASPGYYRVLLETYGIDAELTAGLRAGMHRYTFPPGVQANVLIDAGRQIPGGATDDVQRTPGTYGAALQINSATRTVTGTANTGLTGQGYAVHFAARFDRPFSSHGTWASRGGAVAQGSASVSGNGAGGVVSFDTSATREVNVKVGISYVSIANALANLEDEMPGETFDFDAMRASTRAAWNEALGVIEVEGGTLADRRSFYTALYHAQHHPNVFNDANGDYVGHDRAVHRIGAPGDPMPAGSQYYANFSMWDTYRAEMPLLATIASDRYPDMMRSLATVVKQMGRMPRWSLNNTSPDFMNGEPALQVIADGFCRGLVPSDALGTLYAEARHRALVARRDPAYLTYGYVPHNVSSSGGSATLEHALGDFALALVADRLGQSADRDALLARAGSWRNQLDPDTRFMRPRMSTGAWVGNPYLPEMPDGWREGTGWQYTWLVPHDVAGLFGAMGAAPRAGDAFVRERMDTFFSAALTGTVPLAPPEAQQKITAYGIAYYGNQYAPSNEHDLQAPWLYNWTAEPWKTQALARAYQGLYRAAPDGLPGNDDLGTMSAWYVWSALGLYPVTPGSPTYVIGSPVFERARVLAGDATFTIEAPGASAAAKYVQSVTLDGNTHTQSWVADDAVRAGRTLRIQMGLAPNLSWATGAGDRPPSQTASALADFACAGP